MGQMRRWFSAGLVVMTVFIFNRARAADEVSCECEHSSCAPCESETGITFYSAKCGPKLARVKSCKKPTCVPVENQNACLAALHPGAGGAKAEAAAPAPAPVREPASTQHRPDGEVIAVEGASRLFHAGGAAEAVKARASVFAGDRIETKADGKVKVRLRDSSEVIVAANSNLTIEKVKVDDAAGTRQIALNLLRGRVRSRVQKRYDGGNSFTVKTRTAVAGVRGTDFVARFEPGEKEWVSEIRTFEGKVHLENARRAGSDAPAAKEVDVPAGTYASLVIGPPAHSDDDEELFRAIDAGFVSPVFKMKDEDAKALQDETEFNAPAASTGPAGGTKEAINDLGDVCQAPSGKFNQCSFTCEGNPKGAKTCRTDLPNVTCVRRLCNANGVWTEPHRMPANAGEYCEGAHISVRDCGAYW